MKTHPFKVSDMSTAELKTAVHETNRSYYRNDDEDSDSTPVYFIGARIGMGAQSYGVYGTEEEIRAELAKRPHLSSKKEGKLLRRLKAETGMNEAQLRAHPKFGQMLVDVQLSHPRKIISKHEAPFYKMAYGSFFESRFLVKD